MTAGQILGWIIAGLIVSLIARACPWQAKHGAHSYDRTGDSGAIVGGFITTQLFGPPPTEITVEGHWRALADIHSRRRAVVWVYAVITKQTT